MPEDRPIRRPISHEPWHETTFHPDQASRCRDKYYYAIPSDSYRHWVCTREIGHSGPHIGLYGSEGGWASAWVEHDPDLDVDEGL